MWEARTLGCVWAPVPMAPGPSAPGCSVDDGQGESQRSWIISPASHPVQLIPRDDTSMIGGGSGHEFRPRGHPHLITPTRTRRIQSSFFMSSSGANQWMLASAKGPTRSRTIRRPVAA